MYLMFLNFFLYDLTSNYFCVKNRQCDVNDGFFPFQIDGVLRKEMNNDALYCHIIIVIIRDCHIISYYCYIISYWNTIILSLVIQPLRHYVLSCISTNMCSDCWVSWFHLHSTHCAYLEMCPLETAHLAVRSLQYFVKGNYSLHNLEFTLCIYICYIYICHIYIYICHIYIHIYIYMSYIHIYIYICHIYIYIYISYI